jgi:hypothetical protein
MSDVSKTREAAAAFDAMNAELRARPRAEAVRAELCAKFPAEFEAGYRYGLTGGVQPPCDAAGYPIGFREWPRDRRNAWWAGFNLGHVQRQADHG